jgi:hypothetical protein
MSFTQSVQVPCPGTLENAVPLTNSVTTPYGIQNPYNSGSCPLFLAGLDSSGSPVNPQSDLRLAPGESASAYYAPAGADVIVVVCDNECSGDGEITFDAPVS